MDLPVRFYSKFINYQLNVCIPYCEYMYYTCTHLMYTQTQTGRIGYIRYAYLVFYVVLVVNVKFCSYMLACASYT